jgi:hypothetical protein
VTELRLDVRWLRTLVHYGFSAMILLVLASIVGYPIYRSLQGRQLPTAAEVPATAIGPPSEDSGDGGQGE